MDRSHPALATAAWPVPLARGRDRGIQAVHPAATGPIRWSARRSASCAGRGSVRPRSATLVCSATPERHRGRGRTTAWPAPVTRWPRAARQPASPAFPASRRTRAGADAQCARRAATAPGDLHVGRVARASLGRWHRQVPRSVRRATPASSPQRGETCASAVRRVWYRRGGPNGAAATALTARSSIGRGVCHAKRGSIPVPTRLGARSVSLGASRQRTCRGARRARRHRTRLPARGPARPVTSRQAS